MPTVTLLLDAAAAGDAKAASELLPLVYSELRALAAARFVKEKPGQTLQATALVHEAYVRLVGSNEPSKWNGRGHFFAAAAEAMRRILVEAARRKGRLKRGAGRKRIELEGIAAIDESTDYDLVALSEALDKLALEEPDKADLVKLRYFGGLTLEEAAACQGISLATAKRWWVVARAWLYKALADDNTSDSVGSDRNP